MNKATYLAYCNELGEILPAQRKGQPTIGALLAALCRSDPSLGVRRRKAPGDPDGGHGADSPLTLADRMALFCDPTRKATRRYIEELMPPGQSRIHGRLVDNVEAVWRIAIRLEIGDSATAEEDIKKLWAALATHPERLTSPFARAFVKQTDQFLHSRVRSTRALGERGRRMILGTLLRPFRAGGKTGRPRNITR